MILTALVLALTATTQVKERDVVNAYWDNAKGTAERQAVQHVTVRHAADDEAKEDLRRVLQWLVPSMTTTIPLEPTLPQPTEASTLFMLDLQALKWDALPALLADNYPYVSVRGARPAIVRADWLVTYLLDDGESQDASQKLLFGKALSTEAEWLAILGAEGDPLTVIEDDSGVAISKTRQLNLYFTRSPVGSLWLTRDYRFKRGTADSEPLDNLLDDPPHDASELIGGLEKRHLSDGERSVAQVYALFDGKGDNVYNAPPDIVFDSKGPRGPELRSSVSCVACHGSGLNLPTLNALRALQGVAGNDAAPEDMLKIQTRYMTRMDRTISRWNEDYQRFCQATYGGTGEELVAAVDRIFRRYDAPLKLDDAARELGVSPEDLAKRIKDAELVVDLPARVIAMRNGLTISRVGWEKHYAAMYQLVRGNLKVLAKKEKPKEEKEKPVEDPPKTEELEDPHAGRPSVPPVAPTPSNRPRTIFRGRRR